VKEVEHFYQLRLYLVVSEMMKFDGSRHTAVGV